MSTEIDTMSIESVCVDINDCKLSVTLGNDVVHFEAVGIVSEEKGAELKDRIKGYSANEL